MPLPGKEKRLLCAGERRSDLRRAGSILNMQGWTWEAVAEYTLKCTRQTMSASRLAVLLSQACDELYEEKPETTRRLQSPG